MLDPKSADLYFHKALFDLPAHQETIGTTISFADNSTALLETWPDFYHVNDHIKGKGRFSFLFRMSGNLPIFSGQKHTETFEDQPVKYEAGIGFEIGAEVVIGAPVLASKGNPWKKEDSSTQSDQRTIDGRQVGFNQNPDISEDNNWVCKSDSDTECNVPTFWLSVSLRDVLKASAKFEAAFKENLQSETMASELSPRILRKHGLKIPFQVESVDSDLFVGIADKSVYFKKFALSVEAKLPELKSKSKLPLDLDVGTALQAKPTLEAGISFKVPATSDNLDALLGMDIGSMVVGCAIGTVAGVVYAGEAVGGCASGSLITEGLSTIISGATIKPQVYQYSSASMTISPEFTGKKEVGAKQVKFGGTGVFGRGRIGWKLNKKFIHTGDERLPADDYEVD